MEVLSVPNIVFQTGSLGMIYPIAVDGDVGGSFLETACIHQAIVVGVDHDNNTLDVEFTHNGETKNVSGLLFEYHTDIGYENARQNGAAILAVDCFKNSSRCFVERGVPENLIVVAYDPVSNVTIPFAFSDMGSCPRKTFHPVIQLTLINQANERFYTYINSETYETLSRSGDDPVVYSMLASGDSDMSELLTDSISVTGVALAEDGECIYGQDGGYRCEYCHDEPLEEAWEYTQDSPKNYHWTGLCPGGGGAIKRTVTSYIDCWSPVNGWYEKVVSSTTSVNIGHAVNVGGGGVAVSDSTINVDPDDLYMKEVKVSTGGGASFTIRFDPGSYDGFATRVWVAQDCDTASTTKDYDYTQGTSVTYHGVPYSNSASGSVRCYGLGGLHSNFTYESSLLHSLVAANIDTELNLLENWRIYCVDTAFLTRHFVSEVIFPNDCSPIIGQPSMDDLTSCVEKLDVVECMIHRGDDYPQARGFTSGLASKIESEFNKLTHIVEYDRKFGVTIKIIYIPYQQGLNV